ncbi:hypothetical protein ES702_01987 [subsurface metagenome]
MVIEREVLEQPPGITNEQLVSAVKKVIVGLKQDDEEKGESKQIKDYMEDQKRKEIERSDPNSDKSLVTKEMLNTILSNLKKSKEGETLPVMTVELRAAMSQLEKIRRREIFAKRVQDMGASVVDAYNMVDYSPQDKAVMRQRIINSMTDEELEEAVEKCTGDECKPLRANLLKRGYRIERRDEKSNKWEPLPATEVEQEKKKVETHF